MVVPDADAVRAGAREWSALAVLTLPTLLLSLDNTVLVLALPQLSGDLRPSPAEQLWIMDSYGFLIAGFLVTMGALGDRIGRRRLLLVGAAAFGVFSVVAAYAPSVEVLIAARMALGIAGATLMPSSLALITTLFTDARQRGLAVGIFIGAFMGGAAIGPLVGGALLETFWWGSVFLLGVPVMMLLLVAGPWLLPEGRGDGVGRLDVVSVALSLATVLPVVYGLKELAGSGGPTALPALVVGVAAGWSFVRRQRRVVDPLLDLRLLALPTVRAVVLLTVLAMVVQGGVYLVVGQYLQLVRGLGAWTAGLWLVPPALALAAGSLAAPVLARRFRPAVVLAAGLGIAAVGLGALVAVEVDSPLVVTVAALTIGFGALAPVGALGADLVLDTAPPERSAAASSVVETSGELGIALGMAMLGAVGAVVYRTQFASSVPGPVRGNETLADVVADVRSPEVVASAREAFTAGVGVVAAVGAGLCAILAIAALRMLREARSSAAAERG